MGNFWDGLYHPKPLKTTKSQNLQNHKKVHFSDLSIQNGSCIKCVFLDHPT